VNRELLTAAYDEMYEAYGPQYWWPGDSPWEICVGAVLTQNTNWGNVEKAIALIKQANALDPEVIIDMPRADLEDAIRPSGFFRLKADRLLSVTRWWFDNVDENDRPVWKGRGLEEYRRDLLAVKGVGPETADSILLYCFDLPTFVIDAYTKRIVSRHFGISADIDYHKLQKIFMDNLPVDPVLYNEYHALIVRAAKEHCRKNVCEPGCPLCKLVEKSPNGISLS